MPISNLKIGNIVKIDGKETLFVTERIIGVAALVSHTNNCGDKFVEYSLISKLSAA